ncbi:hypothetical protein B0T21DRAFT_397484 [Apiosordaria backusii]|uniref:Uncharacterized protein n=1 Tax=Apiosordaria backusii TaxID=314023 RepID=A0AA40DHZ4_9PEZI|nr:hypothetical protein B0T21DRAFT_397484 [Apiosordaria backusii]
MSTSTEWRQSGVKKDCHKPIRGELPPEDAKEDVPRRENSEKASEAEHLWRGNIEPLSSTSVLPDNIAQTTPPTTSCLSKHATDRQTLYLEPSNSATNERTPNEKDSSALTDLFLTMLHAPMPKPLDNVPHTLQPQPIEVKNTNGDPNLLSVACHCPTGIQGRREADRYLR